MSASNRPASKRASPHRYPPELRERAVRMVLETIKATGERHCEFPLTGTGDAQIYGVQMPLAGNPNFAIARYTYELAFEDVGGNLFDQNGLPRSRKTIDLLWTFDNAWEQLKDGHPGVFIRHGAAVIAEDIKFTLKRLLRTTLGF